LVVGRKLREIDLEGKAFQNGVVSFSARFGSGLEKLKQVK